MRNVFLKMSLWAGVFSVMAGCHTERIELPKTNPSAPITYFPLTPQGRVIRRVAMLPVFHDRFPEMALRDLDIAFNEELSKTTMFEVVTVSRRDLELLIGQRELSSVSKISGDLFRKLKDQFGVDAVMFTDLTHYSPYRPVAIGVRSKLVDIQNGRIHWSSDVVYDTSSASVADSAREYSKVLLRDNFPAASQEGAILMSPRLFAQFAAWANYTSFRR